MTIIGHLYKTVNVSMKYADAVSEAVAASSPPLKPNNVSVFSDSDDDDAGVRVAFPAMGPISDLYLDVA